MRWLDGITDLMDVSLSELREAWRAVIHGVTKSRTRLSDRTELTEQYWVLARMRNSWDANILLLGRYIDLITLALMLFGRLY